MVAGEWVDPGPLYMDEVASMCGYFRSGVDVNNGYGCDHPDQAEIVEGHGCCQRHSCPFAVELEPEEQEDREYMAQYGFDTDPSNTGWMRLIGPIHKGSSGGDSDA